jgi:RNA polymerase sigma factor (sigma-70 family)
VVASESSFPDNDAYRAIRTFLIRFLIRKGARDPEDLADETICRGLQRIQQATPIENMKGYLCGIAGNVFQEDLRILPPVLEAPPQALSVVESAFSEEMLACLETCKRALLTSKERYLIERYYVEGQTIEKRKQLAAALGVTENALRQQVFKIRKKLRRCLEERVSEGSPRK